MRILIIEDDITLCQGISYHLKKNHYIVDYCCDGLDGLQYAKNSAYDLILLDRLLPSLNGLDVLRQLRTLHIHTPIIMITALSELNDKIDGLDAGADDYIAKPFEIDELLARIRAVFRRSMQVDNSNILSYADVSLNLTTLVLSGPTNSYTLSKRESTLAEILLRSPNSVIPRNIIFAKVWGPYAPVEDGNIDNYIHFLRRRFHTVGSQLQIITQRGVGYRLELINAEKTTI